MSDIGETIRELRDQYGYSQEDLASLIGTTKQAICHYEKNRRKVSLEVATKIAEVFNVPVSRLVDIPKGRLELLEGIGGIVYKPTPRLEDYLTETDDTIPATSLTMIPVIGCVRGGPGGLACEERLGVEPAQIRGRADDYFYLKVVGDSMAPAINEGDLALVRRQDQAENGQLVVAIVKGEFNDEGTIKQFNRYPSALTLTSFNPAFPPLFFAGKEQNRVRIIGKVVQTVRKWD